MKQYVSFVVISLFIAYCSFLYSHGFHKDTIIYCRAGQAIQSLGQIIDRVKKNKCKYVTSYDQRNHTYIDKRARAAGFAQVPFYCALSFNNEPFADIICSPTQHFYRLFDQKWIPACDLHIGDKLLSKKMGSVKITDIVFVEERLQVYTIQVKDTHTFLVGSHGIVAHNIILPITAALGVTIPFSTGCGSGLGVVFGPVGFIGGILLGVGCGLLVNACFKERYVEYGIALQGEHVSNYVLRNEQGSEKEVEVNVKTVEDLLSDTKLGRKTAGKTKQYEKEETGDEAFKDFESMGVTNIENINNGKRGILPDGRDINVRTDSSFKAPTLEIYDRKTERSIKIRYTGRKG